MGMTAALCAPCAVMAGGYTPSQGHGTRMALFARCRSLVLACFAALLFNLAASPPCRAQGQASPSVAEYQIKAAYLYKFLGFVEWPPQAFTRADAPLVIGVLGANPLADELAQVVATRQASGRPVAVRRLKPGDGMAELHVLFVARGEAARLPGLVATARDHPLLIVTEIDDAMPQGSAINFVVVEDKVRFDVALPAAEKANLRISARLLTVARKVLPS